MKNLIKLVAVGVLAAAMTGAMAQGGGGGGRGGFGQGRMQMFGGGGSDYQLLSRADVQKDLGIDDATKTKIQAVQDKLREEMRQQFQNGGVNFRDMSDADRQKMMDERAAAEKKAYEGILTEKQTTRLHEIGIQLAGNRAILRADVQKELALTDAQKQKIKDLQAKQQEAMRSLFQKMQDQEIDREQMQESMQNNNKVMDKALGELLTAEQSEKLKKMGGAPFKADENIRRGGGL